MSPVVNMNDLHFILSPCIFHRELGWKCMEFIGVSFVNMTINYDIAEGNERHFEFFYLVYIYSCFKFLVLHTTCLPRKIRFTLKINTCCSGYNRIFTGFIYIYKICLMNTRCHNNTSTYYLIPLYMPNVI